MGFNNKTLYHPVESTVTRFIKVVNIIVKKTKYQTKMILKQNKHDFCKICRMVVSDVR